MGVINSGDFTDNRAIKKCRSIFDRIFSSTQASITSSSRNQSVIVGPRLDRLLFARPGYRRSGNKPHAHSRELQDFSNLFTSAKAIQHSIQHLYLKNTAGPETGVSHLGTQTRLDYSNYGFLNLPSALPTYDEIASLYPFDSATIVIFRRCA